MADAQAEPRLLFPGLQKFYDHAIPLSWLVIRITVVSDERLREIAEDFNLTQASTERRGKVWFGQVASKGDGVVVIAAGPTHQGEPG